MIYPASTTRDSYYASSAVLVEKGDLVRLQDAQLYYDLTRKNLPHMPIMLFGSMAMPAILAYSDGPTGSTSTRTHRTVCPIPGRLLSVLKWNFKT